MYVSEENAVITNGHFSSTARQHTRLNTFDCLKKENDDFMKPDMWPPNNPDLNPMDNAVCGTFNNESITDEN